MKNQRPEVEDECVELTVKVNVRTAAWLAEIADLHHCELEIVASAVLNDVREDDQNAHQEQVPSNVIYLN